MHDIEDLLKIMARLRDPRTGCPWDVKQDFSSIAPYTIEEAYEVADAIDRGDLEELRGELGDLLLQVVFHAQMAQEAGAFAFADVVNGICEKMIRRHPHVFADVPVKSEEELRSAWEQEKKRERGARDPSAMSAIDGVARALPALMRSEKLQRRAAHAGFAWPGKAALLAKLDEELSEVKLALESGVHREMEEEIGDLLFMCTSLALQVKVDAEQALRRANDKFARRLRHVEGMVLASGRRMAQLDAAELQALWQAVKAAEKEASGPSARLDSRAEG